ncbi:hypothetical protein JCM11251_001196 [Rhodosporidiobolus azoricus]
MRRFFRAKAKRVIPTEPEPAPEPNKPAIPAPEPTKPAIVVEPTPNASSSVPGAARSIQISKPRIDLSYRLLMTSDLEFDITSPAADVKENASKIPLKGAWSLRIQRDAEEVCISLEHEGKMAEGLRGVSVLAQLWLAWIDPAGKAHTLVDIELDPAPLQPKCNPASGELFAAYKLRCRAKEWTAASKKSRGRYKPEEHRKYRFIAVLQQTDRQGRLPSPSTPEELAKRMSGFHLQQVPHDVRILFPHASTDEVELWAKADFLYRCSPYFKHLLSSGFAEAQCSGTSLVIDKAGSDKALRRIEHLNQARMTKPLLPLPVSPKSAYRLAHLLQLEDLQNESLEAFRSSLSAANAAYELFTDTALAYDELREIVVEVIVEKWKDVKKTEGWQKKVEAIKREEIPGGGAVLVELLQVVSNA